MHVTVFSLSQLLLAGLRQQPALHAAVECLRHSTEPATSAAAAATHEKWLVVILQSRVRPSKRFSPLAYTRGCVMCIFARCDMNFVDYH